MTWSDEIRRAAFRGIEFDALDISRASGRRLVVHEYPHREQHLVEDLGRSPRRFTLRAFLTGDRYQDARDTLEAALTSGGPGELRHPWRGVLFVHAVSWTISETSNELGSCTLDMEFVEHQAEEIPLVVEEAAPAAAEEAAAAAVSAGTSLDGEVAAAVTVGALPPLYRSLVELALVSQDAAWASALGLAEGWLYTQGGAFSIASVYAQLAEVVRIRPLLRAVTGPLAASVPSAGGRYDSTAAEGYSAAIRAAHVAMLGRAVVLVVGTSFASSREATEVLGMFTDAFEAVRPTAPDDVDEALAELQAIASDVLSEAIERSPRVTTVQVADVTPAMVLAWELYGDVSRESEILGLNAIANPATLRGSYEVLT